ncbi:MAG TPA: hypothetical protein VFO29_01555 [Candidatus Rubrimentiphilum sp.]|nr:hypothetical protein [Candidatus Rubrimentiphilum sp.]
MYDYVDLGLPSSIAIPKAARTMHYVEIKTILGAVAIVIALIAYATYLNGISSGSTKPHAFSWLLWALLTGTAFAAQVVKGGGAGAWATGASSVACAAIGILALRVSDRRFHALDWAFLCGSLLALLLWFVAKNVTLSVIALTATDVLGYGPTLRKGWLKPNEDMVLPFALNSTKYVVAIIALQSYSLETWLYPGSLIVMNGAVALMLWARRGGVTI